MNVPWSELLRPTCINDILGNNIRKKLKILKKLDHLPNLILYGASGLGKTSSILALSHELIPDTKSYSHQVIELNASDERGIDVVRNKIKMFTNKKVVNPDFKQKIVILDESDNLTSSAQQALRHLMTEYKNVLFVLSCNNLNLIIEPIQSRSQVIKYEKITNKELTKFVNKICDKFDFTLSNCAIKTIIAESDGDIRSLINICQKMKYYHDINYDYHEEIIQENNVIKQFIKDVLNHSKNLNYIAQNLQQILHDGHSIYDIINGFMNDIVDIHMNNDAKFKILESCAKSKINYNDGLISEIQLMNFISDVYFSLDFAKQNPNVKTKS
jgi:replication factor C subunit 2/4